MPEIQMPLYECHKKVYALKIKGFERVDEVTVRISFENERYAPKHVAVEWCDKHVQFGTNDNGYLVVYQDGYTSWSPTKAFEEGYTLITE